MKKLFCFLLLAVLLCGLCGCGAQKELPDFYEEFYVTFSMTRQEVVALEESHYFCRNYEEVDTMNDSITALQFTNGHTYQFDAAAGTLRCVKYPGAVTPELMELLVERYGSPDTSRKSEMLQWKGTVDGVRCTMTALEATYLDTDNSVLQLAMDQ